MKTATAYRVVSASRPTELNQEVQKLVDLGWQPLGGVQAVMFGEDPAAPTLMLMQAVVTYED